MSGVPLKAIYTYTTLQLNGQTTLRIHLVLPVSRENFKDVVRLVNIISILDGILVFLQHSRKYVVERGLLI